MVDKYAVLPNAPDFGMFLLAALRSVGGTLVLTPEDGFAQPGEVIEVIEKDNPRRYVYRLYNENEEQ